MKNFLLKFGPVLVLMKNFLLEFGLVLVLMVLSLALALWSINSLAQAGGADVYIEHTLANYWAVFILILVFRGGG